MESLTETIEFLISLFTVINLVLYTYSWVNNKSSRPIQLLALYTLSLFVTHFTMSYLFDQQKNNLYIGHYHFGFQFLFLGLFYRNLFTAKQKKIASIIMILVFAVFVGYYIIKPEKYVTLNLIDIFITSVPLVFFSIIHLYNMLTTPRRFFIINAAILMYLSTSSLIFFLGTYIHTERELFGITEETANNIWEINILIYLIYLIFITTEWKATIYKWKLKNN